MRFEAGVVHRLHALVRREKARDGHRVLAVHAHARRERADAAQHEPGVERRGHAADELAHVQRRRRTTRRCFAKRERAALHVAVAAEVLRRRVQDDVGAELDRTLQRRRGERAVDDEPRAALVRDAPRARARSTIFISGFDGDSAQTTCVSARIALRTASRSSIATTSNVSPQRSK